VSEKSEKKEISEKNNEHEDALIAIKNILMANLSKKSA